MAKNRFLAGCLYLAGAALSAYLLAWYGGCALLAALAGTGLSNMASPEQPWAMNLGGLAALGAFMASSGLCLALFLLVAGLRAFAGKPSPSRRSTRAMLLYSAVPVGLTVALAMWLTARPSEPARFADLEGVWHPVDSANEAYRFNPDGTVDGLPGTGADDPVGQWNRTGSTVTVIGNRDWHLVGTIGQNSIKATRMEASSGKTLGPEEWVRDTRP